MFTHVPGFERREQHGCRNATKNPPHKQPQETRAQFGQATERVDRTERERDTFSAELIRHGTCESYDRFFSFDKILDRLKLQTCFVLPGLFSAIRSFDI